MKIKLLTVNFELCFVDVLNASNKDDHLFSLVMRYEHDI